MVEIRKGYVVCSNSIKRRKEKEKDVEGGHGMRGTGPDSGGP